MVRVWFFIYAHVKPTYIDMTVALLSFVSTNKQHIHACMSQEENLIYLMSEADPEHFLTFEVQFTQNFTEIEDPRIVSMGIKLAASDDEPMVAIKVLRRREDAIDNRDNFPCLSFFLQEINEHLAIASILLLRVRRGMAGQENSKPPWILASRRHDWDLVRSMDGCLSSA